MDFSKYSREDLIKAAHNEYVSLCHDDPEFDSEKYLSELNASSDEELQEEIEESIMMDNVVKADGDEEVTLDSFMQAWLQEN